MKRFSFKIKILISILFVIITLVILNNNCFAETVKTMTIVLDPGHGGYESGAVNYSDNILEKDINLTTARYLRDFLNNYYGVKVIMTHDGLPSNQEMEIVDRSMVARNNNADLLLCLHYNAAGTDTDEANGAEIYVTSRTEQYKYKQEATEIGELILKNLSNIGIRRRGIFNRFCQDEGEKWQYYDGSQADYYGIIRYAMKGPGEDRGIDFRDGSGITTVLIEHAFIRGRDVQFFNTNEKIKKIAEADGKAVVDHYNLKLKSEVPNSISVSKENISMVVGDKEKVTATIAPDTAKNKKIKWKTDNEKIAKVTEDGEIEAIDAGTVKITAIADGNEAVKKDITVTVIKPYIEIENGSEISTILGSKVQLLKNIGTFEYDVKWKSENDDIAKVDNNGLVTTLEEGTAVIKASVDELHISGSIKINVKKLDDGKSISFVDYKNENGIISNFDRLTNDKTFTEHIKMPAGYKAKITKSDNTYNYVGTGSKVEILDENNNVVQTYLCRLYGDVNGDGRISTLDYTLIKNNIMEVKYIVEENIKFAADVNNDARISTLDYTLIKNDIMDVKPINKR